MKRLFRNHYGANVARQRQTVHWRQIKKKEKNGGRRHSEERNGRPQPVYYRPIIVAQAKPFCCGNYFINVYNEAVKTHHNNLNVHVSTWKSFESSDEDYLDK